MAMLGAQKSLTQPVPFYPTTDDQVAAIGLPAATGSPATRGMFGAPLIADQAARAGATQSAAPAVPAANDTGSLFNADLPQRNIDYSSLAAPIDLSKAGVRHPGFFQHGGVGEKILHGLGEFALSYSAGQGNPYAMAVIQNRFAQQAARRKAQEEAAQQTAQRNEWLWRESWKRTHPDDQFTEYLQAAGIDPASPQGQALYRQRATTLASPAPQFLSDGMGGGRWAQPPAMDYGSPSPAMPSALPTRPVGRLTPIQEGGAGGSAAPRTFPLR